MTHAHRRASICLQNLASHRAMSKSNFHSHTAGVGKEPGKINKATTYVPVESFSSVQRPLMGLFGLSMNNDVADRGWKASETSARVAGEL